MKILAEQLYNMIIATPAIIDNIITDTANPNTHKTINFGSGKSISLAFYYSSI